MEDDLKSFCKDIFRVREELKKDVNMVDWLEIEEKYKKYYSDDDMLE